MILSNGDYDVAFDNKQATITGQASSKTILSERTTFYMNSMLQNVVTSGTGTSARLSGGMTTAKQDRHHHTTTTAGSWAIALLYRGGLDRLRDARKPSTGNPRLRVQKGDDPHP